MAKFISTASKKPGRPKRKTVKPKRSKVIIVLNVLIGILLAAVIITGIGFWNRNKDNYYNREFGDASTRRDLEREGYSDLLYEYYYNGGWIGKVAKGYEDVAAVAQYADAAFRCSAYENAGESERAAVMKKRMEEAASAVGIYGPELEKIDSLLSR